MCDSVRVPLPLCVCYLYLFHCVRVNCTSSTVHACTVVCCDVLSHCLCLVQTGDSQPETGGRFGEGTRMGGSAQVQAHTHTHTHTYTHTPHAPPTHTNGSLDYPVIQCMREHAHMTLCCCHANLTVEMQPSKPLSWTWPLPPNRRGWTS